MIQLWCLKPLECQKLRVENVQHFSEDAVLPAHSCQQCNVWWCADVCQALISAQMISLMCDEFQCGTCWQLFRSRRCKYHIFQVSVQRDETRQSCKQTEREAGMLESRICREFLIFSLCCCSGRFTNPTCVYVTSWEWDSINCLCGVFRNSWDKILLILPLTY